MHVVIFELTAKAGYQQTYLDTAAELLPILQNIDGFISIERFESLVEPGKILSLSFWRDEAAVKNWRNVPTHRAAQRAGRQELFENYRLSVAKVDRQYGLNDRAAAPEDSIGLHG